MRNAGVLGLALLAAFVAFCFTRDPQPRSPGGPRPRRAPRGAGDGDGREATPGVIPRAHVHAGDPSVRH